MWVASSFLKVRTASSLLSPAPFMVFGTQETHKVGMGLLWNALGTNTCGIRERKEREGQGREGRKQIR